MRTLDYVATVTEVDDRGRAVAVRFRFRAKLEHPSFVWATWDTDEFVPTTPRDWCGRSSE